MYGGNLLHFLINISYKKNINLWIERPENF
jgi:hypothetical protein